MQKNSYVCIIVTRLPAANYRTNALFFPSAILSFRFRRQTYGPALAECTRYAATSAFSINSLRIAAAAASLPPTA